MKIVKWIIIVGAVLALLFFLVIKPYGKEQTKSHSPEKTATYKKNDMNLIVHFSSPFKKDRVIFGELVPYDVVWRTGANEPTTFTTTSNIKIGSKVLSAGTYSLWTIPGKENWKVIFNDEVPEWGVTMLSGGKKTARNPDKDAVLIEVPVTQLPQSVESFTITFEESDPVYLSLAWDKTQVRVPINK